MRPAFITIVVALAGAIAAIGFLAFPGSEVDFLLNLTSEAVGIVAGGLVVYAIIDYLESRARRRQWEQTHAVFYNRIYLETETIQFAVQPMANWNIGNTLGEDIRYLIMSGPKEIDGAYLINLSAAVSRPFESLNSFITPRAIALSPDERLIRRLLDLEESGLKLALIARGTSNQVPPMAEFAGLVNHMLEAAAKLADYLDEKLHNGDAHKAAQARFERLRELRTGTSWSSNARSMVNPGGS